ncbi:MAG: hypothetical protein RLZZ117_47 [Cyanobacteriota bacterium]|jgi:hypothetical protein
MGSDSSMGSAPTIGPQANGEQGLGRVGFEILLG